MPSAVELLLIVVVRTLNGNDQRIFILAISKIIAALNSISIKLSFACCIILKSITLKGHRVLVGSRTGLVLQVIESDNCFIVCEHGIIGEAFEFYSEIWFKLGQNNLIV